MKRSFALWSVGAACAVASVLEARPRTVDDVLATVGPVRRPQLQGRFQRAGVRYPPRNVALAAFKQEREMELWASDGGPFRHVARYTIQAASGGAGPKLREGDLQVPEGVYRLTLLNPNSSHHLSMRVDYPNGFDRAQARRDGRSRLGGDIYIHGRAVSIGCLAMGDEAIEELFVLAADTGLARTRVVISPNRAVGPPAAHPPWVPDLYAAIKRELAALR